MRADELELDDELSAIIAEAWRMFGHSRVVDGLGERTGEYGMPEETWRQIIATPVADLTLEHMAEYTDSLHLVYPTSQDELKALLPRYMELIVQNALRDRCIYPSEMISRYGSVRSDQPWPVDEATLLDRFLRRLVLLSLKSKETFEEMLATASLGGFDFNGIVPELMGTPDGLTALAGLLKDDWLRLVNKRRFGEGQFLSRQTMANLLRDVASTEVQDSARRVFDTAESEATLAAALVIIETGEALADLAEREHNRLRYDFDHRGVDG